MYDQSIRHFSTAVGLRPNEAAVHYNLALAYIEADDMNRAEDALNDVVRIDSRYWQAYHRLGEVFVARGENDAARTVLTRLLETNPTYPERGEVEEILASM
jgi:Tfp pilus assembly protein PilF